jgi:hypothetical protein
VICKVEAVQHDVDTVVIEFTRGKPMRLPRTSLVDVVIDKPLAIE